MPKWPPWISVASCPFPQSFPWEPLRFVAWCLGLFSLGGGSLAQETTISLEKYREASEEKWAKAFADFDQRNAEESHPPTSVLFVGSSSIRRWNAIAQDMAPYHPIQRGFGGSRWSDLAVHADQLITPHQFQAVVCFVANDIAGKPEDKEPQEVRELVSYFVRRLRAHDATAPIFLIPVTPTPKRWKVWPTADQANTLLRALCQDDDGLHFI
ncbi:MAG: hypothetical protein AAF191_17165, partial [Verrucomicrobiota bacterium]